MEQSMLKPQLQGAAQSIIASLRRDVEKTLAVQRALEQERLDRRAAAERRRSRKKTLERILINGRRGRIVQGLDNLLMLACDPAIREIASLQSESAVTPRGICLYSAYRVFGQGWDNHIPDYRDYAVVEIFLGEECVLANVTNGDGRWGDHYLELKYQKGVDWRTIPELNAIGSERHFERYFLELSGRQSDWRTAERTQWKIDWDPVRLVYRFLYDCADPKLPQIRLHSALKRMLRARSRK